MLFASLNSRYGQKGVSRSIPPLQRNVGFARFFKTMRPAALARGTLPLDFPLMTKIFDPERPFAAHNAASALLT